MDENTPRNCSINLKHRNLVRWKKFRVLTKKDLIFLREMDKFRFYQEDLVTSAEDSEIPFV